MTDDNDAKAEARRIAGRKGGLARVPKGFAKMSPERLYEASMAGVEARKRKRERNDMDEA